MESERSLFIIKPDSICFKNEIFNSLMINGFTLSCVREIILTKSFLEQLYSNPDDKNINDCNIKHLTNKKSIIGIASWIDGKYKLLDLCGHDYNPSKCNSESLRYRYSKIRTPIFIDGISYYVNAIHRSMPEDAEKEIAIYLKEYYSDGGKNG